MPLLLVRHAKAGNRQDWGGDDRLRPLSAAGARQADELARRLAPYRPSRILASPYLRCRDTVAPLAEAVGVVIEEVPELAEGHSREAAKLIRRLVASLEGAGEAIVICSHGDVIPEVLDYFVVEDDLDLGPAPRCAKGSTWVIEVKGGQLAGASYLATESSPSRSHH
jgi:broad specificity phosphatase PhoE